MYRLLRPLIFLLDPEKAHQLTRRALNAFGRKKAATKSQHPLELWGLTFPNRVGLAAGWDKDGECIDALFGLGFGFVEVGTVTPLPQVGNPKPRLFRLPKASAIINRMGFNNKGVDYLVGRLQARTVPGIVGVNIGKNKETPNDSAHEDYLICLKKVYQYADYITINISSPNTPGLRDLHAEEQLDVLLGALDSARDQLQQQFKKRVPLLIKISPDFPHEGLDAFLRVTLKHHIDGVIATNTTIKREGVEGLSHADEAGGLSGQPLAKRATDTVAEVKKIAGDRLPIIGVGGIDSVVSAHAKFTAGADLIQLYSGLVYQGPRLISAIIKALSLR
ncbi:MAG: dihydroorotate dehydrogenase (quinone) [Coxiella sp. (in: Bacteria)]|nr:MAG: dihydroorotate dehydrogenase (quinone) [Coxiella sp. (in: g-proteobacteria)]